MSNGDNLETLRFWLGKNASMFPHVIAFLIPQKKRKRLSMTTTGFGRRVYASVSTTEISRFVDTDKSNQICFRCGEVGHVRSTCLSYKVRLCQDFTATGCCNNKNCYFAHGYHDLRNPWKQRCVRVVREGTRYVCIGCNSTEHTFRKCPYNRNVLIF